MRQAGMLLYEGMIRVPQDGEYRFGMQADGAFLVRLHEATLLDGSHGYQPGAELEASARLEAGFHPIRIYFHKKTGTENLLSLRFEGAFFH